MTEAEWLTSDDPYRMMYFVLRQKGMQRRKDGRRKLRLFASFSCRQLWHAMTDERSRRAVEVAERFADDRACLEEAERVREEALQAHSSIHDQYYADTDGFAARGRLRGWLGTDERVAAQSAGFLLSQRPMEFAYVELYSEYNEYDPEYPIFHLRRVAQAQVLRCIFGELFRPVAICPVWWTATSLALAHTAYDERIVPSGLLDRDRLGVLSDALEDAGCEETTLLDHLRGTGPHARGCWALDLLIGKRGRKP